MKVGPKAFLKEEVRSGWFKTKIEYIPVTVIALGAEVTEYPSSYNNFQKNTYQKVLIEMDNKEKREVRSTDLLYVKCDSKT